VEYERGWREMSAVPNKILLAIDGSEDAALTTRAAVEVSGKSGVELHLVHTWHDVPSPYVCAFGHPIHPETSIRCLLPVERGNHDDEGQSEPSSIQGLSTSRMWGRRTERSFRIKTVYGAFWG
jgi:hypothetical protein